MIGGLRALLRLAVGEAFAGAARLRLAGDLGGELLSAMRRSGRFQQPPVRTGTIRRTRHLWSSHGEPLRVHGGRAP